MLLIEMLFRPDSTATVLINGCGCNPIQSKSTMRGEMTAISFLDRSVFGRSEEKGCKAAGGPKRTLLIMYRE